MVSHLLIGLLLATVPGTGRAAPRTVPADTAPGAGAGTAAGAVPGGGADGTERGSRPHGDVTCAGCHRGPAAARDVGAVPRSTCTRSGCHADGGPDTVRTSTVVFRHRDHGRDGRVAVACASCHGHREGGEPLAARLASCGLCHGEALTGVDPGACLTCHREPSHVPLTSQGVAIPHAALPGVRTSLPWVTRGCTRCHYDVGEPVLDVPMRRCAACHEDVLEVASAGVGSDVHPIHTGVGCTACHVEDAHRVRAMSSVIRLACGECHPVSHGTAVAATAGESLAPGVCNGCHATTHAAQQRLTLGVVPGVPVEPSFKFMAGLTCASCHLPGPTVPSTETAVPRPRDLRPCASCHPAGYRRVLSWWIDGSRQRALRTAAYLERADRSLGGAAPAGARSLLDSARAVLELVEEGGALHNLEVSDAAFREAVGWVARSYEAAGRVPPPEPDLGRPPRPGFCSYCHYPVDQVRRLGRMPLDFHREVLDLRRDEPRDTASSGRLEP